MECGRGHDPRPITVDKSQLAIRPYQGEPVEVAGGHYRSLADDNVQHCRV
jgi:hypothetical protein